MLENLSIVDINLSLSDADLLNYVHIRHENKVIIKIESWDARVIEFIFYDVVAFIDKGGNFISEFCIQRVPSEFFQKKLMHIYSKVPDNHPYKVYVFLDVSDNHFLEIMSPYYEFNIKK
jgi:hypothetical protein